MKSAKGLLLLLFLLMLGLPCLALFGQRDTLPPASQAPATVQSAPPASSLPPVSSAVPRAVQSGFRILDTTTGKIVSVSEADFLPGAVAAEMSPLSKPEALKAQAVAAYTYYARLRAQQAKNPDPNLKGADFQANLSIGEKFVTKELMQTRYGGKLQEYTTTLQDVAKAVQGQALTYGGELIDATYYAISSGQTESSEDIWGGKRSYLVAVASPGDMFAGGFQTTVTMAADKLKGLILQKAPKASLEGDAGKWFGAAKRTASGSVQTMTVGGQELKGSDLRGLLGLRSQNFTASYKDGSFTFTVKGYGHGVGMSQAGAQYMAIQGADYKQILALYYPTTTLETLKV